MSELLDELKGKASQFEKNSIKKDLATLKSSYGQFKAMTSKFERDSITKDLTTITAMLKRFLNLFKKR